MKRSSFPILRALQFAVLPSLLCIAVVCARADTPATNKVAVEPVKVHATRAVRVRVNPAPNPQAQILVQAYRLLENSDHDYKGNRVAAMKQIEAACRALHTNVHGNGAGGEAQPVSDNQIAQAGGLLHQAHDQFASRNQTRIVEHIDAALKHLSLALKIK